jgi:Ca2+-binding EF-hand superfamily protein
MQYRLPGRNVMSPPQNRPFTEARRTELREDFQEMDSDGDGCIDIAEFETLLDNMGAEMSRVDVRIGFHEIDVDRDGKISCDEFIAWRTQ